MTTVTMNDELLEHDLRKRLKDAEKVLRQLERQYKGDTRFYADQIEYVNALRGSLASMP